MRTWKVYAILIVACMAVLLSYSPVFSAMEPNLGLVRVINSSNDEVTVSVREFDYSGRSSWREIARVRPRSFIELPDVRKGVQFRARSASMEWEFTVEYPSGSNLFSVTLSSPSGR